MSQHMAAPEGQTADLHTLLVVVLYAACGGKSDRLQKGTNQIATESGTLTSMVSTQVGIVRADPNMPSFLHFNFQVNDGLQVNF